MYHDFSARGSNSAVPQGRDFSLLARIFRVLRHPEAPRFHQRGKGSPAPRTLRGCHSLKRRSKFLRKRKVGILSGSPGFWIYNLLS